MLLALPTTEAASLSRRGRGAQTSRGFPGVSVSGHLMPLSVSGMIYKYFYFLFLSFLFLKKINLKELS